MKTAVLQIRLDSTLKKEADALFASAGFDTTTAVRLFLKQSVIRGRIPFDVVASSEKTLAEASPSVLREPAVAYGATAVQSKETRSRKDALGCMRGKMWMAEDFDAPLDDFKEYMTSALAELNDPSKKKIPLEEVFGCARGQFNIPDDFDEPLEDFKEYME